MSLLVVFLQVSMQISAQYLQLIKKYNRPGPRCNSYPPANHFRKYEDYAPLMSVVEQGDAPLALYHLPACAMLCWFCGCHQITTPDRNRGNDYLDPLEKWLGLFAAHLPAQRDAVKMHFSGGTPNFLSEQQIDRLA